jgi:hypothetical protein
MKVEIRKFRCETHLLLLTETEDERRAFDLIFGKKVENYNHKRIMATLCTDDAFVPYLRIKKELGSSQRR